jgi:serine/tyrosine/threonine adenylyltransferase
MSQPSVPAVAIDALRYQNRFVGSLPGDPLSDNRTRQVLGACYSRVEPTAVAAPQLLAIAPEVAQLLELSVEPTPELAAVLTGNKVVPGMQPYAACYGGHQFGHWAGQLGDGRAITLAEIETARGESFELQLKGAGRTPYSRSGDGRAVLRSSLREFVCSEAMHHLGVPTTRALSLTLTGERVVRDLLYDGHPAYEPSALVARVAPSFLRFGNFEIHAMRKDYETLARLVQFAIERYFPQFALDGAVDVAAWFEAICQRTARLMVEWTRVGFVHGVMNTDNMSILGLTIDYGPYGWLEGYDPDWTPNTTDATGRRYRFGQQARVAHWNLAQLARAIAPLFDDVAPLERSLGSYADTHAALEQQMLRDKLGLRTPSEADAALIAGLWPALQAVETDMTLFFRKLSELPAEATSNEARLAALRDAFYEPDAAPPALLSDWLRQYTERVRAEPVDVLERRARMHAVNPLYVPRNYLLQLAIDATQAGDPRALHELVDVLRQPYAEQPGRAAYAQKRPDWARNKPGCSMLSCSS